MNRVSYSGELLFGEGREYLKGNGSTNPIDIGRCSSWCIQFGTEGGTGTVKTFASAGDVDVWVALGDTYTIEDGTMLVDKVVPYRFVRFEITAPVGTTISGILTMAVS